LIKLLVVDDSALMRKLMGKIFGEEPDFSLRFARNGVEALAEIAREKPDVITLDIQMPEMDGLTCLDRIMVECPCPVVMLSSLTAAGAEMALEALQRGAVDVMLKPKAVSLGIEAMSVQLKEKLRSAAGAKLRLSLRLRERVQHRIGGWQTPRLGPSGHAAASHGLVLIGASTGGPPALETVLTALPKSFPWPVLVAQHMPASFTAALARRLDPLCALNIMELAEPIVLAPGHVYIGRGDTDMIVECNRNGLVAMPVAPEKNLLWHPSTDRLVQSAVRAMEPKNLVGILMTGMGNDGAAAMTALRDGGGRTIAESEETAVVWGMPGELVRRGGADFVLPLGAIATRLRQLVN
jgi:two-component system chemotaxis response regulator CheB